MPLKKTNKKRKVILSVVFLVLLFLALGAFAFFDSDINNRLSKKFMSNEDYLKNVYKNTAIEYVIDGKLHNIPISINATLIPGDLINALPENTERFIPDKVKTSPLTVNLLISNKLSEYSLSCDLGNNNTMTADGFTDGNGRLFLALHYISDEYLLFEKEVSKNESTAEYKKIPKNLSALKIAAKYYKSFSDLLDSVTLKETSIELKGKNTKTTEYTFIITQNTVNNFKNLITQANNDKDLWAVLKGTAFENKLKKLLKIAEKLLKNLIFLMKKLN